MVALCQRLSEQSPLQQRTAWRMLTMRPLHNLPTGSLHPQVSKLSSCPNVIRAKLPGCNC